MDDNGCYINMEKLSLHIIIFFVALEIILLLLDIFIGFGQIIYIPMEGVDNIFSMTEEHCLANFLSSLQTIFAGLTLIIIFFILKKDNVSKITPWLYTGLFFIFMGINDGTNFYKSLGDLLEFFLKINYIPVFYKISPLFCIITVFFLYFLRYELKTIQMRRYIFSALLCFTIALLTGIVSCTGETLVKIEEFLSVNNVITLHYMGVIVSFCHMTGNSFLWYFFLKYLSLVLYNREIIFTEGTK